WRGGGEVGGELHQLGGVPAGLVEPAPQRLPGDVAAFPVAQPDDVEEGTLRRVQPDRPPSANVQRPTTQLEGARLELVYAAGRPERRPRVAAAWDRDVNGGRDRVEEAVAGQRRLPAQRCPGGAVRDLAPIRGGGRRNRPAR